MNTGYPESAEEIEQAWRLWKALTEYTETLWVRYEAPFMIRLEQTAPTPDWFASCELDEDDIPF